MYEPTVADLRAYLEGLPRDGVAGLACEEGDCPLSRLLEARGMRGVVVAPLAGLHDDPAAWSWRCPPWLEPHPLAEALAVFAIGVDRWGYDRPRPIPAGLALAILDRAERETAGP